MPAGSGTHGPAARPAGNSGGLSAEPGTRGVGPGQASPRCAQLPAVRTGQRRDPVLDALRGACVVSMVVAHLAPDSVLYRVTHPLVWVDGAAGFIFFSGLVLGITQRARSAGVGGAACRRWLWQRAAVIYLAHVTLVVVALGLRAATAGPAFVPPPAEIGSPPAVVLAVLTLGLQPPFLDILPLYVVLLIGAVGLTELLRRDRGGLCLGLSLGVYIASQVRADLFTPGDGRDGRVPWVWGPGSCCSSAAWSPAGIGGADCGPGRSGTAAGCWSAAPRSSPPSWSPRRRCPMGADRGPRCGRRGGVRQVPAASGGADLPGGSRRRRVRGRGRPPRAVVPTSWCIRSPAWERAASTVTSRSASPS